MKREAFLNEGFIVAVIVNYLELLFLYIWLLEDVKSGAFIALITLVGLYLLVLTPAIDIYYRCTMQLRKPVEREQKRIDAAWRKVREGAEIKGVTIPPHLKLYVLDDNGLNAFAVGKNTIAVHTGMLRGYYSDEILAGVLGHELGHIVSGDTISLLMSIQGNFIMQGIQILLRGMLWLAGKIIQCIFGFIAIMASDGDVDIGIGIAKIVELPIIFLMKVTDYIIWAIMMLETIVYRFCGRRREFAADMFSATLGLGQGLIDFFETELENQSGIFNKFSLEYILYGTHPPTQERVERIRQYLDQSVNNGLISENRTKLLSNDYNDERIVSLEREKFEQPNAAILEIQENILPEKAFVLAEQYMKCAEYQKGIFYLEKAVEGEIPKAYTKLGKCYLYGTGVEKNIVKASEYLKKALVYKDAEGIYLLGECYATVRMNDKYTAAAFKCYNRAADMGYLAALLRMAECYFEGYGIAKDEVTAYQLLKEFVGIFGFQESAEQLISGYLKSIEETTLK